jgi:hypothetical protein
MRIQEILTESETSLQTIIQSFVDSPVGQKYKQHDCKTVTRAFVQWAEQNKIPALVISLAPPSAEFIKKNPQFKGKSGQGDGHIMPVVNSSAIDFTVRQFGINRPFENPLVTPTNSLQSVYGKFGYFTDKPEWFLGGKSHWMGKLSSIPKEIFNQNFGDEILEQYVDELLTESEPYLLPAYKDIKGRIHVGKRGENHGAVVRAGERKYGEEGEAASDGVVNHKGHYLNRERAMDYAIKHDLIAQGWEPYLNPNELHTDALDELTGYREHPIYKQAAAMKGTKGDLGKNDTWNDKDRIDVFVDKIKDMGYKPVKLGRGYFGEVYQHPRRPDEVIKLFHKNPNYLKWAEYCKANSKKNEHLPRITMIKSVDNQTAFVMMEKLEPLTDKRFKDAMGFVWSMYGPWPTPAQVIHAGIKLKAEFPKLYYTFKDMAQRFGKIKNWDMHSGNFMQRGDTPVITDPIGEGGV